MAMDVVFFVGIDTITIYQATLESDENATSIEVTSRRTKNAVP